MRQTFERLHRYLQDAGRDPSALGIQAQVNANEGNPDEWVRQTKQGQALGATHVCFNTMGAGFTSHHEHLEAIRRYKEAIG
jgi:membrane-bound lytic murein transglycosylase MltF